MVKLQHHLDHARICEAFIEDLFKQIYLLTMYLMIPLLTLKQRDKMSSERFEVLIDDVKDILTLVSVPGSNQTHFQYNTKGNKSAHCFNFRLSVGQVFRTNGHRYQILKRL